MFPSDDDALGKAPTLPERSRTTVHFVLLHILLGPLAGIVVAVMFGTGYVAYQALAAGRWSDLYWLPTILISSIIGLIGAGYAIGILPATLPAVAMVLLSRVLRSRRVWVSLTPIVGLLAGAIPVPLLILLAGAEDAVAAAGSTAAILAPIACGASLLTLWALWWAGQLPPMHGE